MDRKDHDLLNKQMRHLNPPPANGTGTAILAVVAVFLAGMTLGGCMVAQKSEQPQTASNDLLAAMAQPRPALPIAR